MTKLFQKEIWSDILFSLLLAVLFSIGGVLIFALIVKFFYLSDSAVLIGNTVIKLFSVFFGVFLGLRHNENGAVKGAIIGVLYILLSYFVFSLMSGGGLFAGLTILGILFGAIIGIISGIIAVNVHK